MKTTAKKLNYLFELVYISNSQYRDIKANSYNEAKMMLPNNAIQIKLVSVYINN